MIMTSDAFDIASSGADSKSGGVIGGSEDEADPERLRSFEGERQDVDLVRLHLIDGTDSDAFNKGNADEDRAVSLHVVEVTTMIMHRHLFGFGRWQQASGWRSGNEIKEFVEKGGNGG